MGKAKRCGEHPGADTSRGNGADDEDTGSDSEGHGRKAEVVGSSRDHRGDGPDDAPMARTLPGTWLQRTVGLPEEEAEPKRIAVEVLEKVLQLYREKYFDFNVQHFHEKLKEEHGIEQSYTWVKTALQEAGLVERRKKRGSHRKRRPRRAMPGMMLHIDASEHDWFQDGRKYELIVILDDATSEIYYAQLVEAECTRSMLSALREVVRTRGVFCSLYSDRAGHFFVTPKAGQNVDKTRLTQVGRALGELGIKMIPAYSPQARGRSERNFGTWQGRLPQELRCAGFPSWRKPMNFSATMCRNSTSGLAWLPRRGGARLLR